MIKVAEKRVVDITNHYGWYRHKYGDVRLCLNCGQVLPKSENAPDFAVGVISTWWEAKNSDATGSWKCSELFPGGSRENQRKFLQEKGGWLFIELGEGNAPKGKGAFLIPWITWEQDIEPKLNELEMKSIRLETSFKKDGTIIRPGADQLLSRHKLEWVEKVGWTIPPKHVWWFTLAFKLEKELDKARSLA